MLAASNMSRITLLKSSFSFGVSSHLVRGSLSFTSSSSAFTRALGDISPLEFEKLLMEKENQKK
jgi:hypothetical protein